MPEPPKLPEFPKLPPPPDPAELLKQLPPPDTVFVDAATNMVGGVLEGAKSFVTDQVHNFFQLIIPPKAGK